MPWDTLALDDKHRELPVSNNHPHASFEKLLNYRAREVFARTMITACASHREHVAFIAVVNYFPVLTRLLNYKSQIFQRPALALAKVAGLCKRILYTGLQIRSNISCFVGAHNVLYQMCPPAILRQVLATPV